MEIEIKADPKLLEFLQTKAKKSIAYAVRNGLNNAAYASMLSWRANIKSEFINRNQYTVQRTLYTKVNSNTPGKMVSVVGSAAWRQTPSGKLVGYMAEQEDGAILRPTGKHGKSVAVPFSAGGSETDGGHRKKMVRSRYKITTLAINPKVKAAAARVKNPSRANAVRIVLTRKLAAKGGDPAAYLGREGGKRAGIYKIWRQKSRGVTMVWNLDRPFARIRPTKQLKRVITKLPLANIMNNAFMAQFLRYMDKA